MGTYTTNYNLFMPTVGETGWGTLVNTNFSTIDSTMKSLSNRITAVEGEVNGNLNCTSVTTSGKITGNGGIAGTTGTFSGAVTGASFNGATITSNSFNGIKITKNLTPYKMYLSTKSFDTLNMFSIPTLGININTGGTTFNLIGSSSVTVYPSSPTKTIKGGYCYYANNNLGAMLIYDVEILDGAYTYTLRNNNKYVTVNVNGYGAFTETKTITFAQAKTLLTSTFDIVLTCTNFNGSTYQGTVIYMDIKANSTMSYAIITRG